MEPSFIHLEFGLLRVDQITFIVQEGHELRIDFHDGSSLRRSHTWKSAQGWLMDINDASLPPAQKAQFIYVDKMGLLRSDQITFVTVDGPDDLCLHFRNGASLSRQHPSMTPDAWLADLKERYLLFHRT